MILKNYYNFLKACISDNTYTFTDYQGYTQNICTPYGDNAIDMYKELFFPNMGTVLTAYGKWGYGVIFGDSDEAVTGEEHLLRGNVIAGITATSVVSKTFEGNKLTITVEYTITNNNASAITIKEIGYFGCTCTAKTGATNSDRRRAMLYDRTVLGKPLEIPAAGVARVTYNIVVEFPM